MGFIEATYENSIIELFQNMGYQYVCGYNIDYRNYNSPLYDEILEESLARINKLLPKEAIDEALYKLRNFENGTLITLFSLISYVKLVVI